MKLMSDYLFACAAGGLPGMYFQQVDVFVLTFLPKIRSNATFVPIFDTTYA
ncbi:hypothetical protein EDD80_11814 [Anseongella ginsenosidimutans]|uniref:Uncharacterized protein n=1 Tax=Anseongella ginsenosidimutans TaxID=496056 RepID=A0A4R3KNR1_9SPHI|nr:hypothetical protein EDD80_11814 [Anseongella ginsenosidimutans]